ncbi:hypothetical protein TREPR_1933 [Treponema primitia ZAS-2]|uniref:Uncharacterized protein n=1 Tax=Treponema primitia (strain ATCC BAA-887 / DSM 12427 / ZAS-2) TaxID=545694 RepID=F5YKK1_TREPZ|nr:hypothetical protein TREPR_1933 [Treponema primitia ZAS-2]
MKPPCLGVVNRFFRTAWPRSASLPEKYFLPILVSVKNRVNFTFF